jgi:hypothetical protein
MRNSDGVDSLDGSGFSLSDLLGGNRRWGPRIPFIVFRVSIPISVCPRQDGLFFLQLMKWGVLQYSVIRPTCVISRFCRLFLSY